MGTAETAGIVIITVAIIQGLISLVKYVINKQKETEEEKALEEIDSKLEKIDTKLSNTCLTDNERDQLKTLYDMHVRYDTDGVPMWYVPRSWAETNEKTLDKLQDIANTQLKILGIITQLEKRIN